MDREEFSIGRRTGAFATIGKDSLVFRRMGKMQSIPLAEIVGVKESAWGARPGADGVFFVYTKDGNEFALPRLREMRTFTYELAKRCGCFEQMGLEVRESNRNLRVLTIACVLMVAIAILVVVIAGVR